MKKARISKIISTVTSVITVAIIAFSLTLMIISANAKKKGQVPHIFGKMFFMVLTDSMQPEINPGDLIYVSRIPAADIKEGDYIVFYSQEPKYNGMLIVHKVEEIEETEGTRFFYTKGLNAPATDEHPTSQVLGIYQGKLKLLSGVIKIFQDKASIFIIFAIIFFLLVAASQVKRLTMLVNKIKLEKETEQASPSDQIAVSKTALPEQELTDSQEDSKENNDQTSGSIQAGGSAQADDNNIAEKDNYKKDTLL